MKSIAILLFTAFLLTFGCTTETGVTRQVYTEEQIAVLQAQAKELDEQINVSARKYYEVYTNLGQAYMQIGDYYLAADSLKKGLRLNSRDFELQMLAAEAEYEIGAYNSAYYRLTRILGKEELSHLHKRTRKLVAQIEKRGDMLNQQTVPDMHHRVVYLLKVGDVDDLLLSALANRIDNEFQISVEVIDDEIQPSKSNLRDRHSSYYLQVKEQFIDQNGQQKYDDVVRYLKDTVDIKIEKDLNREFVRFLYLQTENGEQRWTDNENHIQDQYDATAILDQIKTEYPQIIHAKNSFGILAVTEQDIYAKDYNFLFGWNSSDVALMSYNRFLGEAVPTSTKINRTVMQGFSSVGYVIGIPRCTVDSCARAYPHSLAEHDQKEDILCNECKQNLTDLYGSM